MEALSMKKTVLNLLAILFVACVSLTGCVSTIGTVGTKDEQGCIIPPASILSSVGIDATLSGNFLNKIIPNINVKIDPKVIETGSKALHNMAVSDYVSCCLIHQYNIPSDQILSLKEFYLFYATAPSTEQYMKYIADRPLVKQMFEKVNNDKSFSGTMNGKRIYVDAIRNASMARDGWTKGSKVTLPAGNWEVRPVSGGWSAWAKDSYVPPNVAGPWSWSLLVTRDNGITQSMGGTQWNYKTVNEASAAAVSIEPVNFSLDKPTDVYFWVWDSGGVSDNRGVLIIDVINKGTFII
jgi:hypothetical protein